ncbi:hypothetical protein conserved [Leishmania donovani]|uniref:Hypothetical_protein_conserved n=1 Tax=Leishmania donovani TaxID=5661 RepID=A0A3S7WVS2_LEIDO|nr:hypothetical protein, unknown function [Leishmania donovani]AYU78268.1 hypothetical protein LdCL_190021900 [Leishmania donovani]TPP41722.1 hypothetical protein CGC20_8535 [Leishmania donovani]TPP50909.1 hypothetical protein CGC21_18800 [Leishmania donovani]CAJ1988284.1 hypothetical protein conserved [Leishmania donovani]CBZ33627.1 hypothetical protein, unknown function [Leishmania donovani]
MPLIGDCMRQLAEQLRGCDGVVAVDPLACASFHEETAARIALEALSLLLLDRPSERRTDGMCAHRRTWCGIGVLRGRESDVAYNSGEGASVLWNVVPVALTVVPWQVELPRRLQDLVLCQGHFASIDQLDYGSSDVGPVPDTFLTREAVALLCGLPRCRVQAVSGRFPLFGRVVPPSFSAAPRGVTATDATWSLVPSREVSPARSAAAAQRHARRLMPFLVSGLSSLMEPFSLRNDRSVPECWAVVSYPDGLPRAEAAREEVDGVSRDISDTAGAVSSHEANVHESDGSCEAAPFFILPSHLLCRSLRVAVGWQKISPSSRPLVSEVLQRLCCLVDRIALRTDRGVTLTSRTACSTGQETLSATMTIQKASSM